MDIETCSKKLAGFFKARFLANHVFDTTFAREFSLIESQKEFVDRFKKAGDRKLPILSSACPGWICYAEKTHGSFIIPYISQVKSPQQIMGTLVKDFVCRKVYDITPDKIYHVCIMPCYDKKLESMRTEFYNELYQTRDVDCVLSTGTYTFNLVQLSKNSFNFKLRLKSYCKMSL